MMKIAPFDLERYFARYEFNTPYLLGSSDPESMTIAELLSLEPASAEAFNQVWLGYTESKGHPALREAILPLYTSIGFEEVLVTTGAEEAIFLFMNVALSPGEHVIVHTPCYQSLKEVAVAVGCEVTPWVTRPEAGWALDLDFLKANIRPNTRAIVVNSPHNPTGYLMSRDTQQGIVDLARQHGLLLFSDEVYRGLEYDPADRLPAAVDIYENAVSVGVMSKAFALPGLRIGWAVSHNRQILQDMAAYKDYTTICNSAPSEFLAIVGLRHKEALWQRNIAQIQQNLAILELFMARHGDIIDWQSPKAGAIAFPKLTIGWDVADFCDQLVRQAGVMLLPGTVYHYGNQHFRLGFGRKNMPEALVRLAEFLAAKPWEGALAGSARRPG